MVCGVVYDTAADKAHHVASPDELVDLLLARTGTYWAHNGGRYDMLQVAEVLRRRKITCQVDASSGPITRIRVGGLELRDSARLIPMGLDAAAEMATLPPPGALGWPCTCGGACGGYCAITTELDLFKLQELKAYCEVDARTLAAVLLALHKEAELEGVDLRGTVGASAWATVSKRLALPSARDVIPAVVWKRAREGYYGGRQTMFRPIAHSGLRFDLVSAYPSALARTAVPVGEARIHDGKS